MTLLGIPAMPSVVELLNAGQLDIDYLVYYGQIGVEALRPLVGYGLPIYLHDLASSFWLNYADPFTPEVMAEARTMLDLAKSPWLSTGIGASAEPQAHRDGPYREADPEDLQDREMVIRNIVQHGRRLRDWASVPLLLENFNYHPTNAYEYICEPPVFSQLIETIDCGVLLDVAHARISAHNMGWQDPRDYLSALPLNRVRELHVTRPGWEGSQMVDLHQPLQDDDFELIGWILDHTPAEAMTLELDFTDAETVAEQVARGRAFLDARAARG